MTRSGLVALFVVTVLAASSARASVVTVRNEAGASLAAAADATNDEYAVPHDLLIGAGVSAIQTEGAWNEGGKKESAQDNMLHNGNLEFMGYPTGPQHLHDTAADSYHRFKEDIAMAAKLKLKLYRFSFSWSRLLPTADPTQPNQEGVEFYHSFIDEIIRNGMTPMATLYHFDHPEILEKQFQGWMAFDMVAKFKEYARFTFNTYASKVKLWTTINEPNMYCTYFITALAGKDANEFECMRNTILAHGAAYRVFQEDKHEGQVGFCSLITHALPNSTLPEDVYAADTFNQFQTGTILHPVVYGDYPEVVKKFAQKLTPFSDAEKQLIRGSTDFIGFNVYYSTKASFKQPDPSKPAKAGGPGTVGMEFLPFVDSGFRMDDPNGPFSLIEPDAIRSAMVWAWQNYNLPLVVTENGFCDTENFGKQDQKRAVYYSAYLRTLVKTAKDFDIKVIAYSAWSVIDSYEWSSGFTRPFGLVHVDYESGTLDRSLKDSSSFWITMAETGVVPLVELPASSSGGAPTACFLLMAMATAACLL